MLVRPNPNVRLVPRSPRPLAKDWDEIAELCTLCSEGRLYEVEAWIEKGLPVQCEPPTDRKLLKLNTPLQIAVKSGHSPGTSAAALRSHRFRLQPGNLGPAELVISIITILHDKHVLTDAQLSESRSSFTVRVPNPSARPGRKAGAPIARGLDSPGASFYGLIRE